MVARMRGARFVVDWHNLGWTLLAHQRRHGALVATLRAVERWIARRGDAHLCVSRAMREHLADRWDVDAAVCYDRPPDGIAAAPAARDAMRARLLQEAGVEGTPAAILISPTSWTADESTDLLFDTADALDAQAPALPRDFPRIVLLATGRGPGRAAFDARAARRRPGPAATVRSDWVAPASYPALLAAADGGVSLHQSSSGLDLPMKIADMFGAGLPVLALSYPALAERLRDGENGCLFTDAASLARRIVELWSPGSPVLDRLRAGSRASGRDRWLEGWMAEAAPTLL
jgi:beta-1,4-mannosyltransferase